MTQFPSTTGQIFYILFNTFCIIHYTLFDLIIPCIKKDSGRHTVVSLSPPETEMISECQLANCLFSFLCRRVCVVVLFS